MHLLKLLLVGVVLACVVSQNRLAVAHGYNLGGSLVYLFVAFQLLKTLSKSNGFSIAEAEQPLD